MFIDSRTKASSSEKYVDEGLRKYFLSIYNNVALALLITAIAAWGALNVPAITALMYNVTPSGMIYGVSTVGWAMSFVPLGISLYMSYSYRRMDLSQAQMLFWAYSASMGLSLSVLGLVYTGASIVKTMMICASAFAAVSIYGYSTKRDLSQFGAFLTTGLLCLIVASVFNIFLQSSSLDFTLSIMGVGIFLGLIAWDTQALKEIYYYSGGTAEVNKIAILGALRIYTNVINLFIYLLRFFGERRNHN